MQELKQLKMQLESQLEQAQSFLEKNEAAKPSHPKTSCITKEGSMKVREFDQKTRDIPVTQAFLSENRLTYFIDPKDETSIMGSIELGSVLTPIENV